MRVTHFALLTGLCLLIVLGRPDPSLNENLGPEQREEEESISHEEDIYLGEEVLVPVTYKVDRIQDEPLADILWLKEAANKALENGTPYFNVVERSVQKRFDREESMELSVVDGIIELVDDPMINEYDAHIIEELPVNDVN